MGWIRPDPSTTLVMNSAHWGLCVPRSQKRDRSTQHFWRIEAERIEEVNCDAGNDAPKEGQCHLLRVRLDQKKRVRDAHPLRKELIGS